MLQLCEAPHVGLIPWLDLYRSIPIPSAKHISHLRAEQDWTMGERPIMDNINIKSIQNSLDPESIGIALGGKCWSTCYLWVSQVKGYWLFDLTSEHWLRIGLQYVCRSRNDHRRRTERIFSLIRVIQIDRGFLYLLLHGTHLPPIHHLFWSNSRSENRLIVGSVPTKNSIGSNSSSERETLIVVTWALQKESLFFNVPSRTRAGDI